MLGEGLREFGILVAVFVPLDNAFEAQPLPFWMVYGVAIVVGGGVFGLGVYLERRRSEEGP